MSVNVVKKEISLNVGQPNNFELICVMQGDNKAYKIIATLYDVNKLYSIASGSTVCIKGLNPIDENIYRKVDSYTANTVTFTLNSDLLRYEGLLRLVLTIKNSDSKITSFPFTIKIIKSPGDDSGEPDESDPADNDGENNPIINSDCNCVIYYETYDEFLSDYNAGKIETETLVVIKEKILIESDSGGNEESEKIYLYNNGDECVDITGGWNSFVHYAGDNSTNNMYISRGSCIVMHFGENDIGNAYINTKIAIPTDEYSKIGIKYMSDLSYESSGESTLQLVQEASTSKVIHANLPKQNKSEIIEPINNPADGRIYVDCSQLIEDIGSVREVIIYEIWLEK